MMYLLEMKDGRFFELDVPKGASIVADVTYNDATDKAELVGIQVVGPAARRWFGKNHAVDQLVLAKVPGVVSWRAESVKLRELPTTRREQELSRG